MLLTRLRGVVSTSESPLRGLFEPDDAWLSTGDLFRADDDGDLWLVDHGPGADPHRARLRRRLPDPRRARRPRGDRPRGGLRGPGPRFRPRAGRRRRDPARRRRARRRDDRRRALGDRRAGAPDLVAIVDEIPSPPGTGRAPRRCARLGGRPAPRLACARATATRRTPELCATSSCPGERVRRQPRRLLISTDPERLDLDLIHAYLRDESYSGDRDPARRLRALDRRRRCRSGSTTVSGRSASRAWSATARCSPTSPTCSCSPSGGVAGSASGWWRPRSATRTTRDADDGARHRRRPRALPRFGFRPANPDRWMVRGIPPREL